MQVLLIFVSTVLFTFVNSFIFTFFLRSFLFSLAISCFKGLISHFVISHILFNFQVFTFRSTFFNFLTLNRSNSSLDILFLDDSWFFPNPSD